MIATYIQELLATNNRVIVPNYGAFLVRATSKSKDANTLEEKLKDIYFSPFLKFNDELLEKYVVKKENITKEQASQKITQFIDDIKKDLDQDKPYIIEGFGQFVADKQGKVQFITLAKKDVEAKTAPTVGEKEAKKPESKPTPVNKTLTSKKVTVNIKEESKLEEEQKVEEAQKEDVKESKPAPKADLEEFKAEKKEAPSTKVESKASPTVAQTKPAYSYKKEKKDINKGLVWSIAIGLPIAVIFVWALLNFNTVKKVFNKEKVKTEKVAQKKLTSPAKEIEVSSNIEPETTKDEVKESESKPIASQKKYYLIAGSFKNEKYAISYMNKLKKEGYNAEKLEERNGMHAVSYSSFYDKKKAIAEYKFLSQEKGLQSWILYY